MYTGYQEKLFSNSWGVNSGFKHLVDHLSDMLPAMGVCENARSTNKHLDKFRRAQNAAYDLFNNGLCNKRGLFKNVYGWDAVIKSKALNELGFKVSETLEKAIGNSNVVLIMNNHHIFFLKSY